MCLENKVNYDDDETWNDWNRAAKLRILMDTSRRTPMEQYYIEHSSGGRTETPISSLDPSNESNGWQGSTEIMAQSEQNKASSGRYNDSESRFRMNPLKDMGIAQKENVMSSESDGGRRQNNIRHIGVARSGWKENIDSDTESMNDVFSFDERDETGKLGEASLEWDNDSVHEKYPAEVSHKNEELEKRKKV